MHRISLAAAIFLAVSLTSCANKQQAPAGADQPRATVSLRDGSQVTGTVLSSSATEIQIAGDDQIKRTIPMAQVKSIEYGDAPAAAQQPPDAQQTLPPAAGRQAAAEPNRQPPTEAAITTRTYEVPAGTELAVRTNVAIDSATATEGGTYDAGITRDVLDSAGAVVIPRGADARIVIRSASQGGKITGASDLVLDMQSVSVGGKRYQIETNEIAQKGRAGVGANKRTAEFTGGGAALGAIIGAIAGGGRGAAIGAGAGAGAGALTQVLTKGKSIRVPAETVLTFKLDKPFRVVAAR